MPPVAGVFGISLRFCAWGRHRQPPRKEMKEDVGTPAPPRHHCLHACRSSVLPAAHKGPGMLQAGGFMRSPPSASSAALVLPLLRQQAGRRCEPQCLPAHATSPPPPVTVCSFLGRFICPFPGQLIGKGLESPSSSSCDSRLSPYCLLNREQKCFS